MPPGNCSSGPGPASGSAAPCSAGDPSGPASPHAVAPGQVPCGWVRSLRRRGRRRTSNQGRLLPPGLPASLLLPGNGRGSPCVPEVAGPRVSRAFEGREGQWWPRRGRREPRGRVLAERARLGSSGQTPQAALRGRVSGAPRRDRGLGLPLARTLTAVTSVPVRPGIPGVQVADGAGAADHSATRSGCAGGASALGTPFLRPRCPGSAGNRGASLLGLHAPAEKRTFSACVRANSAFHSSALCVPPPAGCPGFARRRGSFQRWP